MIPLSITSDLGLLHHQLGNKMTENTTAQCAKTLPRPQRQGNRRQTFGTFNPIFLHLSYILCIQHLGNVNVQCIKAIIIKVPGNRANMSIGIIPVFFDLEAAWTRTSGQLHECQERKDLTRWTGALMCLRMAELHWFSSGSWQWNLLMYSAATGRQPPPGGCISSASRHDPAPLPAATPAPLIPTILLRLHAPNRTQIERSPDGSLQACLTLGSDRIHIRRK